MVSAISGKYPHPNAHTNPNPFSGSQVQALQGPLLRTEYGVRGTENYRALAKLLARVFLFGPALPRDGDLWIFLP